MASRARRFNPLILPDYSLSELKALLSRTGGRELERLLADLDTDPRKGARLMAKTARRQIELQILAQEHARRMRAHEVELERGGFNLIAGCDEVGRGSLAGPLTAAAVILDPKIVIDGIDDSKKLAPETRARLDREIRMKAIALTVVEVQAFVIDSGGLQAANLFALREAVRQLRPGPDFVLVDAFRIDSDVPSRALIKGDSVSVSIAAASIVAKVHRDNLMESLDRKYPGYGFLTNKGYGTEEHIEAIRKLGPSPIHRRSFYPIGNEKLR